jgi:hypothetical protein
VQRGVAFWLFRFFDVDLLARGEPAFYDFQREVFYTALARKLAKSRPQDLQDFSG